MALFESNIQDITQMNISNELKEQLNIGIQYIFSVVTKLQQNTPDDKYEIHGNLINNKKYEISINAESYTKEHPKIGLKKHKGLNYLLLHIDYNNFSDRPIIYIFFINARENLLSGNSILDISKKFGKKINASKIRLIDASGLISICKGYEFSMTYLYILSNGVSWYNSKGFIPYFFDEEREHNVKLLSLNIVDFLSAQCIYKIQQMKIKRNQTIEDFEEKKSLESDYFYSRMESFFDFFKTYTEQYPFLVKTGLTLTKDMTVQEFFTRIKLFIFRNLPEKRMVVYKELCSQLEWVFENIQLEIIEPDSDVTQLSFDNPKIILYSPDVYYDIDEPKIPSLLHIRVKSSPNISRRRTSNKTKRMSSMKSKSRRRTI